MKWFVLILLEMNLHKYQLRSYLVKDMTLFLRAERQYPCFIISILKNCNSELYVQLLTNFERPMLVFTTNIFETKK